MVKGSEIAAFPIFLLDIILINVSIILVFLFRYNLTPSQYNIDPYISLIPWISFLTGVIFLMFNLYSNWRRKSIHDLVMSIILSILTLTIVTMALSFLGRGFAFPRGVILIGAGLQVVLITLSRSLVWYLDKRVFGLQRVLIIAKNLKECSSIEEKLLQQKGWFTIKEFILTDQIFEVESKLEYIDVVFISSNVPRKTKIIDLCVKYGKEILIVPNLSELFLLRSEPQQIDDMLVLSIRPRELTVRQLFLKRILDISASIILLTIFSPIMIVLFIAIPLFSKGPALFKQERLGKDQEQYQILKFRSMIFNAEGECGPVLASDEDPRITKIGKFIRATRLDELPQLINVLCGTMSLVGPRPERLFFVRQFEETIPHYCSRMSIKPGITGLAQVMGKYNSTVEDKLRLDMMYMHSYSFDLDLKILFRTIQVVLKREQAGGVSVGDDDELPELCDLRDRSLKLGG
ncbi:MAG: sugar transferase [Desulfitobacteriaceae bacterium]